MLMRAHHPWQHLGHQRSAWVMDSVVEGQTLLLQGLGCSLEPAI